MQIEAAFLSLSYRIGNSMSRRSAMSVYLQTTNLNFNLQEACVQLYSENFPNSWKKNFPSNICMSAARREIDL